MKAAAGTRPPFPWDEVMGVAFGLLRLTPRDFWAMTPLELAAAMKGLEPVRGGAPGRRELADLMRLFPDVSEQTDDR